jgi:hypothetical protein
MLLSEREEGGKKNSANIEKRRKKSENFNRKEAGAEVKSENF